MVVPEIAPQVRELIRLQRHPYESDGDSEARCFEDDGQSTACRDGNHGRWRLPVCCSAKRLRVDIARQGRCHPAHTLR